MGLQLIFVVETNKRCKSDWIYIKDTIERFFQYDQVQVKFSPVYMDGKGKYKNKEKEISSLISQYDFVWFCKDVERVYLGKKVDDSQKKKEASTFKAKKLINEVDERRLAVKEYRTNTSNILDVIGRYICRK